MAALFRAPPPYHRFTLLLRKLHLTDGTYPTLNLPASNGALLTTQIYFVTASTACNQDLDSPKPLTLGFRVQGLRFSITSPSIRLLSNVIQ